MADPTFLAAQTNPFGLSDVGSYSSPTLADIDGDGDLDAFVCELFGNTLFFENTGSATSAAFAAASSNPFGVVDVGGNASPSLVDIDGDGDLDAFIGNYDGITLFFENTGSATNPAFAAASSNPFGLDDVGYRASPTFADIDGDGDLDAFIGNDYGNTLFFENTGSATSAAFAAASSNPFGLGMGDRASPTFADIDGDGDLDAFIGEWYGNTLFFRNTGSATSAAFAAASTNPFDLVNVGGSFSPTFADIDGDGDLDALIGNMHGDTLLFENNSAPTASGIPTDVSVTKGSASDFDLSAVSFADPDGDSLTVTLAASAGTFAAASGGSVTVGGSGTASLTLTGSAADINAFLDTVSNIQYTGATNAHGDNAATFTLIANDGTVNPLLGSGNIDFARFEAAQANPFGLVNVSMYASPTLADIDGDGDLDAFIGEGFGNTLFFQNTGSASSAAFAAASTNPFGLGDVGSNSNPTLVDIDSDGDLDVFIGSNDGNTLFFQNTGSASSAAFAAASSNPFGLVDVGSYASPTFVDINGDGDLDAFIGEFNGNTLFFENTGSASSAAFAAASTNPFGLGDVGSFASPTVADFDGDGDLDAFIGQVNGNTLFFENTGSATSVAFAAASTNPFGLGNVVWSSAPTFADIDGDGDLDAFIGEINGATLLFRNSANIAPTASGVPSDVSVTKDTTSSFNLSAITVADADADGDSLTITLAATAGTFSATSGGSVTVGGSGTASLTLTGSAADINAFLDTVSNVQYTGATNATGNNAATFTLHANDGTVSPLLGSGNIDIASFHAPQTNPFGLGDVGSHASPALADIDADGDLDAFIGNYDGNTLFLENTGSASSAAFAAASTTPFGLGNVGPYASPTLADIDADGDLDAFIGNYDGNTLFFENTGSASSAAFAAVSTNPFGLGNVGYYASPTFADIDGDGDLDAFVGNSDGNTLFFENTGSSTGAAFATASSNPFGLGTGYHTSPTLADIDGDGDLDAFIGEWYGNTLFFRNTGSATSAAFDAASTNPFGLGNVGYNSSPTFADIDSDGDLDVFIGKENGTTLFFQKVANNAPNASGIPTDISATEDSASNFELAAVSFADADDDSLTITLAASAGSFSATSGGGVIIDGSGTASLTLSGSAADINTFLDTVSNIRYAGAANATGNNAATFTLHANDGTVNPLLGSGNIDITAVNDAPTASNRTLTAVEDTARVLSVSDFGFTDVDTGNTLQSVTITTLETAGTLKLNGVDITLNQIITAADITAGKLIFTPAANANGTAYTSFGFKVSDGTALSASAYTATLNVTAVNDAPTASNRTLMAVEDAARVLSVSDFGFTDVDTGNTLQSVTITTLETAGTLKLNGVDITLNQIITAADITAGKLIFTPAANANGTAYTSFGFKVSDGTALSASAYTATINVTAVNDAPTASNRTLTAVEDTARVLSVSDFRFTDVDTGNTLQSVTITTLETAGTLKLNGVDVTLNQIITAADITAGKLIFTPAANANGTAYTSFGFKVSDGTVTSASAYTATLNVTAVNDAPTASNRTLTAVEDTARVLSVSDFGFTDVDTGNTLQSVTITTLETAGTLKLNGVDVTLNQIITAADITAGKLIFTPAANANGTAYTSFGFKVSDGTVTSASAYTATINVNAVNDAPTGAVSITGTPVQGQLLSATNTLADADGLGAITYQWLANGSVIAGATASTFTLTSAHLGKMLSVKASYNDAKGNAETMTSASTLAILNGLVTGTTGNDTLMGTYSANTLTGLAGNDLYYVNHVTDVVTEAANAGTDTVYSYLSAHTLAYNVENGRILSSGSANLTGNLANNVIYAASGVNSIDGGAGIDTVSYAYATTSGTSGVTLNLSIVNASAQSTASGISGADLIKNVENITGSNYADTLTGNSGANVLTGGGGIDTLTGGLGNDTYVVALKTTGALEDTISETSTLATEIDILNLTGASINTTAVTLSLSGSLAYVENFDISATGTSLLNLTGSASANILTGNGAANILNGSSGNDTLAGGLGNDSLTGGTGIDRFVFNTAVSSINIDTLTDFVHASDKIVLDDDVFKALGVTGTVTGAALNSNSFYAAAGATAVHLSTDRIVYNTTTGKLYYDADGLSSTAAVQIALIGTTTHAALSASDFLVAA